MARLRAIECRRAVVLREIVEPTNLGPIPIDTRTSLYAIYGDWMAVSASLLLLAGAIWRKGMRNEDY